jgi:hypothetical protein
VLERFAGCVCSGPRHLSLRSIPRLEGRTKRTTTLSNRNQAGKSIMVTGCHEQSQRDEIATVGAPASPERGSQDGRANARSAST